jgi:hypothetical protein
MKRRVENDVAFCGAMESTLPKGGMVFELPVIPFPEGGPVRTMDEYEPLRPFFFTKDLRFSYGSNKGRPREDWQFMAEKMQPPEMVATLERYGFSAVYLNRRGFADRAEGLLKNLAVLGKTNIVEDGVHEQVCVALNPSAHPELPHTDDNALVNYKSGWVAEEHAAEQVRHWSDGNAMAQFFNEDKSGTSFHVTGVIASLSARRVDIEFEGRNIWSREIGAGQGTPVDVWITGKHRNNALYFKTDAPAAYPEQGGTMSVAFGVINLRVAKATQ